MAKNSKSDVAKKAGIIGGAAIGSAGMALGANAVYQGMVDADEEVEVVVDDEVEVEENVEVEYDEVVYTPQATAAAESAETVVEIDPDPIVDEADVNDVALEVDAPVVIEGMPEGETEMAIEVAEASEEDFSIDDIVDDILSDDTTHLTYSQPTEDPGFGADFDYSNTDLLG